MINVAYPFTSTFLDYPDPEAHSISVYMMGCVHSCEGCSSPQFSDPYYNFETKVFSTTKLLQQIQSAARTFKTTQVCLMGGDPLHPANLEYTKTLLRVKTFEVCLYTGYNIEEVRKMCLPHLEYVKCGKYDPEQKQVSEKTDEYIQFASKNQELHKRSQYGKYELVSKDGRYYF